MFKNQQSTPERKIPEPGTMSLEEVLKLVTDAFTGAAEREIAVGDGLEMFVVRTPSIDSEQAQAGTAAALDLTAWHAEEALGGEDEQQDRAVMVIRRNLKRD